MADEVFTESNVIDNQKSQDDVAQDEAAEALKKKKTLEELFQDKTDLERMKENLNQTLKAMNTSNSFFSRFAVYVYEIPLWLQLLIGIVLVVPILVPGILIPMFPLIFIASFTWLVYLTTCFLVYNYNLYNVNSNEEFKKNFAKLADLYDSSVNDLDNLCKMIEEEVETYKQENGELGITLVSLAEKEKQLSDRVIELSLQKEKLTQTSGGLEENNIHLGRSTEKLLNNLMLQKQQITNTLIEIERLKKLDADSQRQLLETTIELDQMRAELTAEHNEINATIVVLKRAINSLSDSAIEDEDQRNEFKQKVNEFTDNWEKNGSVLIAQMSQMEQSITATQNEINQLNIRNKQLLLELERLLNREEKLIQQLEAAGEKNSRSPSLAAASLLIKNNIFSDGLRSGGVVTEPGLSGITP